MSAQVFHAPVAIAQGFKPPKFIPRGAGPKKSKREQNADRQREFRRRNPGYYGRLHAKRKGELDAYRERLRAEERLAAQESATLTAKETASVVAQETAAIRNPVVAAEPVSLPIDPATLALSERAPTSQNQTTPNSERALPETEAMLMMMLLATLAKLKAHRAQATEWNPYRD